VLVDRSRHVEVARRLGGPANADYNRPFLQEYLGLDCLPAEITDDLFAGVQLTFEEDFFDAIAYRNGFGDRPTRAIFRTGTDELPMLVADLVGQAVRDNPGIDIAEALELAGAAVRSAASRGTSLLI
jgi:hypothetical protein